MVSIEAAVQWLDKRIADDRGINKELFARLFAEQRAVGLVHGERPICPFLRPLILERSRYEAIGRAAEVIAGAMEQLVEAALRDDELLKRLALTDGEISLARIDPGYPQLCVTSRLDAYLTKDDFKFLEYNAESPAGMVDQLLIERIFFALPYMREFLASHRHARHAPHIHLLEALLEAYWAWGGKQQQPNIGIIDWKGVSTESEFRVLKEYFDQAGYETIIADPGELEYDGNVLSARGQRIDILYKRVIIHEFLAKYDETHPMVRAYADRRVCMANSFRCKVAHKKASFALLSDPVYENLFTSEQLEIIRRHIPWTRRLVPGRTTFENAEYDLLDLVKRERERMVIKPNDDYGGHGVVIGVEVAPDEWARRVEQAAAADVYVVQQRVAVDKVRMPTFSNALGWENLLVDFDPFLFLNTAEGGIVRLSSTSLSNVSSGGGVTALLVLEDS